MTLIYVKNVVGFCEEILNDNKDYMVYNMNNQRAKEMLQRLGDFADNLEAEAKYYRKAIKEVKKELKEDLK